MKTSKPRKVDPRANGRFMLCHPRMQRVVCVSHMLKPERNAIVTAALEKVLPFYPKCDTFVYDRNCSYAPNQRKRETLQQLKHFPLEAWHGTKHKAGCKYCTRNVPAYKRRHRGINCSICESTYAWFRNYARVLNEMGFRRHAFLVFYYVRRRNDNLSAGDVQYLNAFAPKLSHKRMCKPYRCW